MDNIGYWIETEGSGHYFFIAFPVCLLILFLLMKGRRIRFLIPSLIITLVIINPWFYKKWDELGLYAYWRILWVIPVIPVVAAVVPSITERILTSAIIVGADEQKRMGGEGLKGIIKPLTVVVGIGLVILGGTFLYNDTEGAFVEAADSAKLPEYVIQAAERIKTLDDHSRVIAQYPIGVYMRQYTGEIDQLSGRDIDGYIFTAIDDEKSEIQKQVNSAEGNLKAVCQYMLDEDYDYLVLWDTGRENQIQQAGLELVDRAGDIGIYKAYGIPRIRKERNALGQVISVTTLDEQGNPVNNERGYATVFHDVDSYGNPTRQYFADEDGGLCQQAGGYYIVETTYAGLNKPVSRTYFNENGLPILRTDGYAKIKWNNGSIEFYDLDDNRVDTTGLNLAYGIEDDWSDWIGPKPDKKNCVIDLGTAYLGEKQAGDTYTCQVEIEFKDVTVTEDQTFRFKAQGSVEGAWDTKNLWDGSFIRLNKPPEDGIYRFTYTATLDEDMAAANAFELEFRCDYWASGSFRYRFVKIEKGDTATEWTPGI